MADVVSIADESGHVRRKVVSEDVVQVLEEWLARAKSGDITGLAIAGISHDGSTWFGHSAIEDVTRLIGVVTIMQRDILGAITGTE
jgi:hypothetical protein